MDEILPELSASALEAEALWGNEIRKEFEDLFHLVNHFKLSLRQFLNILNPEMETHFSKEHFWQVAAIVQAESDQGKDAFRQKLTANIKQIESYLIPRIRNR